MRKILFVCSLWFVVYGLYAQKTVRFIGKTYMDVKGVTYKDSIVLAKGGSAVLIFVSNNTVQPPPPIIPPVITNIIVTIDFANTAARTSKDISVAFAGIVIGDNVVAIPMSALPANYLFTAQVTAVSIVTVRFHNYTNSSVNPSPIQFTIKKLL